MRAVDLRNRWRLLKGVLGGSKALTGPFHVMVDVTRRCNMRCLGCRFHSGEVNRPSLSDPFVDDMDLGMFECLGRELAAMGTREMWILGEGEPLLHPGIFDMIAFAKSLGFRVSLITNGTLLDRERCMSLIASGLDAIQVSLWAVTAKTYAQHYPGSDPGNLDRVIDGLSGLSALKAGLGRRAPHVILHHPLTRANVDEIDALADLAQKTRAEKISLSPLLTTMGQMQDLDITAEQRAGLQGQLKALGAKCRSISLKHNFDVLSLRYRYLKKNGKRPFACYIGWYHTRIRLDGTVMPCGPCNISLGNLKEKGFREIWNDAPYRDFRRNAMEREGLLTDGKECDCDYCCYAWDNLRVDRVLRWLRFLRGR